MTAYNLNKKYWSRLYSSTEQICFVLARFPFNTIIASGQLLYNDNWGFLQLLIYHDTQFNNYNFRLAKFSSFSASSKLVSMLGQEEDKLKQSKAQGVAPSVDMNLAQLSCLIFD
jgi:hypothetical protein